VNHAFWVHLAMALGATTVAAPNAAAQPPDGTISSFTGNLASSACINPEGLTVDYRGNFYVGSASTKPTGAICQFTSQGVLAKVIRIPAGASGLVSLLGIRFEGEHTVFALDFADSLAHKGTVNGRVIAVDTDSGSVTTIATGFSFPNGIAEDPERNLYISDSLQGTITRMGRDGTNKTVWASGPLLAGNSKTPLPLGANGIQFDRFFQNMYVANTSYRRIIRIPVGPGWTAGTAVVFADGPTIDASQSTTKSLMNPDGLTLDLFGNIYVAANAAGEIQVLSPAGQLVARYGDTTLPVNFPASPLFVGNQLYFTNVSLHNGGVNSSVAVLQNDLPGSPPP
jgi:sugar lactone lactonase YvrE